MFLPMMGLFFTLVVFGLIAGLPVTFDPYAAHRAPFPYAVFFAGVSAITFVVVGGLVSEFISDGLGAAIALFIAPTVGLLVGAVVGYRLGLIRRRHGVKVDSSDSAPADAR